MSAMGILAMVVLAIGYLYTIQASMIYFPRGYSAAELVAADELFDRVYFETSAGSQMAFYRPPLNVVGTVGSEPASARVWLVFGGNGSRALDWADVIADPAFDDDAFLLIDYPGYGASEGQPTPATIEESIAAAITAAAAHTGVPESGLVDRLAVLGHSLGGAAALYAAEEYGIARIVLISPFTTMREMASLRFGRWLPRLLRHNYDNRGRLGRILEGSDKGGSPQVTIIHGEEDSIIPISMGRELAELDSRRIRFFSIPGAGHNDVVAKAVALFHAPASP